jgi:hypothetical protein
VYANDETWESAFGRLVVTRPTRDVMVFTYSGHVTADVVPFIADSVERVLASGARPEMFIDMDRLDGYDSEYRQAITDWGRLNHPRFGAIHVLSGSKIVAMGVALSNMKGGGRLKTTTERAEFQSALQASIDRQS